MPTQAMTESNDCAAALEVAVIGTKEGVALVVETERGHKDEEQTRKEYSTKKEINSDYTACLTIQPNRVLCGVRMPKG